MIDMSLKVSITQTVFIVLDIDCIVCYCCMFGVLIFLFVFLKVNVVLQDLA